jgi:hypothetical protein
MPLRILKKNEMRKLVAGMREVYTELSWKSSRKDGNMLLKRILKKQDRKAHNGFIWLGKGTRGGLL